MPDKPEYLVIPKFFMPVLLEDSFVEDEDDPKDEEFDYIDVREIRRVSPTSLQTGKTKIYFKGIPDSDAITVLATLPEVLACIKMNLEGEE